MAQEAQQHQLVAIICDACGEPKPHTGVCFDMEGCSHLLCFGCLMSLQDAGSTEGGFVSCPVPGCVDGFLNQQAWVEEKEEEVHHIILEPPPAPELYTLFFCPICMEKKPLPEGFFGSGGCNHVFCSDCICGYVEAKVEENLVPIGCPDPECRAGALEPEACRKVIPEAVFDRWGALLCESAVAAPARFYCPYRDCSALLANEGDEEGRPMTESQCLHCGRTCCAQCRVPWHHGLTCEAYRRNREAAAALGEEDRERDGLAKLMELAKISQWQKCPKCGVMVERVDGCVFIRCR